jgi:sugar O-acyltransferase (sialic acid O-acetyltransferase NeuD family)
MFPDRLLWKDLRVISIKSTMQSEYIIIGASGHAKVIIEIIEAMNGRIKAIQDKNPAVTSLVGYPVHTDMPLDALLIIAIGNNAIRKKIAIELQNEFATAIHPRANISTRSSVFPGTVIMAGATVNSETRIGRHCIVNTNASIDHDCVLEDFVHISPNASLAGNVSVGEGAHIGIGSTVIQGVNIGKWAIVGAGSVIIKDVPDYAVVVGVPGSILKYIKP